MTPFVLKPDQSEERVAYEFSCMMWRLEIGLMRFDQGPVPPLQSIHQWRVPRTKVAYSAFCRQIWFFTLVFLCKSVFARHLLLAAVSGSGLLIEWIFLAEKGTEFLWVRRVHNDNPPDNIYGRWQNRIDFFFFILIAQTISGPRHQQADWSLKPCVGFFSSLDFVWNTCFVLFHGLQEHWC